MATSDFGQCGPHAGPVVSDAATTTTPTATTTATITTITTAAAALALGDVFSPAGRCLRSLRKGALPNQMHLGEHSTWAPGGDKPFFVNPGGFTGVSRFRDPSLLVDKAPGPRCARLVHPGQTSFEISKPKETV